MLQMDAAARSQVCYTPCHVLLSTLNARYHPAQRKMGASHIHRTSLSLDVMAGKDWDIDFEDFLNSMYFVVMFLCD